MIYCLNDGVDSYNGNRFVTESKLISGEVEVKRCSNRLGSVFESTQKVVI